MHLDGEVLGGVDDLEKQRKFGTETVEDFVAHKVAHVDFDGFIEGIVGQEPVGDDRFAPLNGGERPEFAAIGQGFVVEAVLLQFVASPDDVFVKREEFEGIESGLHQ